MLVGGGRLGGEPHCQQTEDQRTHIAQHVPGIRQQRQTICSQPAEEFQQHDHCGNSDGDSQAFFIVRNLVVTHHFTPLKCFRVDFSEDGQQLLALFRRQHR